MEGVDDDSHGDDDDYDDFDEDEEDEVPGEPPEWEMGWTSKGKESEGMSYVVSTWENPMPGMRWQQKTPRDTQDLTRKWDANQWDAQILDGRRGGGRALSRSNTLDSNEYGFGKGMRVVLEKVAKSLYQAPENAVEVIVEDLRKLEGQEADPKKLPRQIFETLKKHKVDLGMDECESFVGRVGIHQRPLLVLEEMVRQSNESVAARRDEQGEPGASNKTKLLLNQAALRMKAGHGGEVTCMVMAPDGSLLVSGDACGAILIWSLAAGDQISFQACQGAVIAVALAHSKGEDAADVLFCVGVDRCLRAFDVYTGVETLCVRDAHPDAVTGLSVVSKMAPMCVTSSADATVRVWGLGSPSDIGLGNQVMSPTRDVVLSR